MSCDTCTRHNQNMNTPSLNFAQESYQGNVSIHADYPMFEQVSQDQFNALLREIGATNSRVARNEVNLIKMGKDMTIMGKNDTWFGTEITKLKNKPTGQGFTKSQIEGIVESYHGDDIKLLYDNHKSQESRITQGYEHRKSIDNKLENVFDEHKNIHENLTKLGNDTRVLGDKLVEAKNERDRIEAKIKTGGNDNNSECEWWDINCKINQGTEDIKNTALMLGAVGIGAFLLMRK